MQKSLGKRASDKEQVIESSSMMAIKNFIPPRWGGARGRVINIAGAIKTPRATQSIVLLGLLCCSVLLLGCQPKLPEKLAEKHATERPVTLTFWTLQMMTFKPLLTDIIANYEKLHPDVHIDWIDVPFAEGEKRALAALMSGEPPDVLNLNPDFSALLASRHALLNMADWVPVETRQAYLPVAWQAVTFTAKQQNGSIGLRPIMPGRGHAGEETDPANKTILVGIPWYLTSSITFYNRALYSTDFLEEFLTHSPRSFEDLLSVARALRKAHGQSAYILMPPLAEKGYFLKLLYKAGIQPFDATTGRAVFATGPQGQRATELLKFWVQMHQEKLIPAEALTEGHRAAVDQFMSGNLAMLMAGPNFLKIVAENAPGVYRQLVIGPQYPPGDQRFIDFSTMLLAIPAKSKHPKQAVDFALFVTNAQNQMALAKQAPVLPSIRAALNDQFFQPAAFLAKTDLIDQARALSARQLLKAQSMPSIQPKQAAIAEQMDYVVQLALLGKLSSEAALRQAETAINQL